MTRTLFLHIEQVSHKISLFSV